MLKKLATKQHNKHRTKDLAANAHASLLYIRGYSHRRANQFSTLKTPQAMHFIFKSRKVYERKNQSQKTNRDADHVHNKIEGKGHFL